jgi:hypothetical protein
VSRVTRGTPSGDAYLDLQNEARRTGRPTQELQQLYVLEGFLVRLAASDVRESFVLKGGVLLAAFDSRRPTKDIDLAGLDLANETDTVLALVRSVLDIGPPQEDGIEFAADTATAEVIREEDDYSGVRVHVEAGLAGAKLPFTSTSMSAIRSGPNRPPSRSPDFGAGHRSSFAATRSTWCTPRRS